MRCEICSCDPCQTEGFCGFARQADLRQANGFAYDFTHFLSYAREQKYIFRPTGELWPAGAINSRLPWIGKIKPSAWLDRNQSVEQMTWAPGEPTLVKDKLVAEGGWIEHRGATVYNLYRPPNVERGDPGNAQPWIDHVYKVYPDVAEHMIQWFAYRCQHPDIKINHALVLGGAPGIGKDTLLAPVRIAVGHWNTQSVSPTELLGRFTPFRKTVILVVSEARDLGDVNRPQFYDHLKTTIAAPPPTLRVDEKNTHEYYIPNLVGVVLTTNYKAAGIYLAADDRRHLVAWSPLELEQFPSGYWDRLWGFYDRGGYGDIAAYLQTLDVAGFDPNAPPPKTEAFWEIVQASRAPEGADLDDVLSKLGYPMIVTLDQLCGIDSDPDFTKHLRDRRNRRMLPRWMESVGYNAVRNPDAKNGLWKLNGKKQMVYGRSAVPVRELHAEIIRTR